MTLEHPASQHDAELPVAADFDAASPLQASSPAPVAPEPLAVEPESLATEPTPQAAEPESLAPEPEPTGAEPEPSAAEPDPLAAVPAALRKAFDARGFDALTAVQSAVLATEAEGRDLQISSQTGSGKTVALGFVLASELLQPQVGSGPEALIIVPTRELAQQVCDELGWLLADLDGARTASVTGGTPIYKDRDLLRRRPRVLVGTPGRLLDHVTSGVLDLSGVRQLVLDEADQMLDMGFRDELEGILDATPAERHTHLVSATFPDGIRRLAARYQRDPVEIEGTRHGDANQDIAHVGHLVKSSDRYAALVNLLLLADGERALVFVERRSDALEVAQRLEADGFAALPLSGELAQSQRERTLAAFRAGRATVLVATDVAARGLDVDDITAVIHTAPPIDAQVYTHRSGRTGRAGKQGRSVLLAPPNRRRKVGHLLADAGVEMQWLPVPSAAEVKKQLAARAKATLSSELDAALAAGPDAEQLAQADELLANRDAQAVVAALLARLAPSPRTEPRNVETQGVREETWRKERPQERFRADRGRPQRAGYERPRQDRPAHERPSYGRPGHDRPSYGRPGQERSGHGRPGHDRPRPERGRFESPRPDSPGFQRHRPDFDRPQPARGGYDRPQSRRPGDDRTRPFAPAARPERPRFERHAGESVRFFVNWGVNQGANPSRLLAAICRRGEVNGGDVGSIAIHPNASTFDVRADVAESFERLAGRRDPRDPQTIIRRDRGPQGPQQKRRRHQ